MTMPSIQQLESLTTSQLISLQVNINRVLSERNAESETEGFKITKPAPQMFKRADRVTWTDAIGDKCYGEILRVNVKTCTVIDDNNNEWRINPSFLTLVK